MYAQQANDAKKWAFVSDYARFVAVNKVGGIYLDTDVEILKTFKDLLECKAIFAFAADDGLTVPFFASEPNHPCLDRIIKYYKQRSFIKNDGQYDMIAIEKTVERVLCDNYGLILNGKRQSLKDGVEVFPKEYFYARDYRTGIVKEYDELYLIHHGEGIWLDENSRKLLNYQHEAVSRYGEKVGVKVGALKYYLKEEGMKQTLGNILTSVKSRMRHS